MIGLIACGGKKLTHPSLAKDLYIGPLFVATRRYIEKRTPQWAILSALHGVVMPNALLSPYDVRLSTLPIDKRNEWAQKTRAMLIELFPDESFLILAGREYLSAVRDLRYIKPMPDGLGIGKQLSWLKRNQ